MAALATLKLWAVAQLTLLSLLVATASSGATQCSDYSEAANASVQLTWVQKTGSDVYTRISHTSEPVIASSTARHRLVTIGGIEYESAQPVVTNPVLVYDVASNTFATPADRIQSTVATSTSSSALDEVFTSPASRSDHASFVDTTTNAIYVFGGQSREFLNDTWRLCLDDSSATTAVWDQLAVPSSDASASYKSVPEPRIGHSFTKVFENSSTIGAIVYGGLSDTYAELEGLHFAMISKVTISSTCTSKQPSIMWRKLSASALVSGGPVPVARAYHSATTTSRLFDVAARNTRSVCMLVYGGKSASTTTETTSAQGSTIFDELWRLCPQSAATNAPVERQTYTWEQLNPVGSTPGARFGAGIAFVEEGKFAVAGGSAAFPSDYLGDSWELNVNASQWVRLSFTADLSPQRRGHSLAYFSGGGRSYLLVMGGRDRYRVVETRIERADYVAPSCGPGLTITRCGSTYVCVPCPAGSYLQDGSRNCAQCPAGTFSSAGAASKCTLCSPGTYSPVTGLAGDNSAVCLSCPAGTASMALGAISLRACISCIPGYYTGVTGSSTCTACPIGTFAATQGAISCLQCPSGSFASSIASASCTSCPAGTYAPATNGMGATVCHNCPRGFYSDLGSSQCSPCPANTSSPGIAAPGVSSCVSCTLQRGFTPAFSLGQTECSFCPAGSTLVIGTNGTGLCQSCAAGMYSLGVGTSGACVPCPQNTYSPISGSSVCLSCPSGSYTAPPTSTSGAVTCNFCDSGQFYDGSACQSCRAGSFPSVNRAGVCSTCLPGTSSSLIWSSVDAAALAGSPSIGCPVCPRMKYTAARGATSCSECAGDSQYDAFAMDGWRNCISCRVSVDGGLTLSGCTTGRNGIVCSGNGECVYGGCACSSGWAGGDCSLSTGSITVSSSTSIVSNGGPVVLYFEPTSVPIIASPVPSTGSITFTVKVNRAGTTTTSLSAMITCKMSNFSVSAPSVLVSPATAVQLVAGEVSKNVSISVAASTLSTRSGCRYITLQLQDVGSPTISAVSSDIDREQTVYIDDMNGRSSGANAIYQRRDDGVFVATITLNRLTSTAATFSPSSAGTIDLYMEPINLLLAIDPNAAITLAFADLLPGIIAAIQGTYAGGIRLGLLDYSTSAPTAVFNSTSMAETLVQIQRTVSTAVATRTTSNITNADGSTYFGSTQWLVDGLTKTNRTWPSSHRRIIIGVGESVLGVPDSANQLVVPAALQSALHNLSAFAFQLTSGSFSLSGSALTVASIIKFSTTDNIPQQISQALISKDASVPTAIDILQDSSSMISGNARVVSFSGSSHSLPVVSMTISAFPASASSTNTSVLVSVPGVLQLSVQLLEPSHSCFASQASKPADPHIMSGWVEPWDVTSTTEILSLWQSSSTTLQVTTRSEPSLLRAYNTTALSLMDPNNTHFTLTRAYPGSSFAAGLPIVLRGYWRVRTPSSASNSSHAECKMRLRTTGDTPGNASAVFSASGDTSGAWVYGFLRHILPSGSLSSVKIELECSTSSLGVQIDWTTLGLFPDPAFACKCSRGFYFQHSQTTADDGTCTRCPAGSYCAAGIKGQCPTGTFSFGEAAICESCRDGWICIGGMARLCNPGTYATAASACGPCPSGYACRNGKKVACPPGTFSPALASDCLSCPPGTFSAGEASTTCQTCSAGSTSNHQRDHCVSCSEGEWAIGNSGQHPCASCATTQFTKRSSGVQEVCVSAL